MRQGYFVYNGKRYESGTEFLLNMTLLYDGSTYQRKCTFLYYDTENGRFYYQMEQQGNPYSMSTHTVRAYATTEEFNKNFAGITGNVDISIKPPVLKQRPDSQIDGLFIGWLWYIVLMAVSTIFYDRIGLWALWTFLFFSWRHSKIEKEGKYYDRQV